jgi:hypothetical protein
MLCQDEPRLHVREAASPARCTACPPDRVCAWDCEQGLSIPDIEYGAQLLLDGKLDAPVLAPDADPALWERYNGVW